MNYLHYLFIYLSTYMWEKDEVYSVYWLDLLKKKIL